MRIKAKLKKGIVKVKAMAKHEMMTYDVAEKKTGDRNNANYILRVTGTVNGETVFDMTTSQFLSKNPIFKFEFKGDSFKKGDQLVMNWVDLKGNKKTSKSKIK